jgi:HlyD family secretion protein
LERKDSILSLEEKYFIFRNDSIYVEVVEDDKLRQIKIETGISDGIHTEIVSGLEQTSQIHVKE